MKAISLREPWAAFMIRGIKTIENRNWPTKYRGTVLVHASSWWHKAETEDCWDIATRIAEHAGRPAIDITLAQAKERRGGIVGSFDIVDCVTESDDPFFFGRYGFVTENPVAFPVTLPCRGALGFFDTPADVLEEARRLIKERG